MAFPILGLLPFAEKLVERILPDPAVATEAKVKLAELAQSGQLAQLAAETEIAKGQIEINKIEAASNHLFVSGWRPSVGWICAVAFAYHFVLQPFLSFVISNYTGKQVILPAVDMDTISMTLAGILGINGTFRTVEKVRGASK